MLAVPIGGRGRRPHAAEVSPECQQPLALVRRERARLLLFTQREFGLCLGELAECVLPVALETARHEPVLGLDLAIAPLGTVGVVFGAFELQPPLLQRGVVVLLERFGRLQRGLHAGWGERGEQRAGDGLVDLAAADPDAPFAAVLDQDAGGASRTFTATGSWRRCLSRPTAAATARRCRCGIW